MQKFAVAVLMISTGLLIGSFGGALHPVGDSLAVFRFWWAMGLLVASVLMLSWRFRLALVGFAVFSAAMSPTVLGYMRPNGPADAQFSIYQKNMLFKGSSAQEIVADILTQGADFITLQEVSRRNRPAFDQLATRYPTSMICPFARVGSVAVLSKFEMVPGSQICLEGQGLAALQLTTPAGPVWAVSVHLHWPFPHRQPEQVAQLLPKLAGLKGPVVLGGDFNMVPWSYSVSQIQTATRTKRAGPVVRTFQHDDSILQLPIDHVLIPGGVGSLALRPFFGSDHAGLLVRFDLPDN